MITRVIITLRHAWYMWHVLSLPKNRSKGSWRMMTAYELITLAEREIEEVKAAVWMHQMSGDYIEQVNKECGDVSAFMAMIADVCRSTGVK